MMRLIKTFLLVLFAIVIFYSCQKDEIITKSSAKLEFSLDTVMFDTVFTTLGSVTKNFRVYNKHSDPIKISEVYLANKTKNFRININGLPANEAKDIEIRAKDSMFVFVEVTVDPNNQNEPMLIQDSIVFVTNGNIQDIDLVAYGQDMRYLRREYVPTQTWTSEKPYLVFDTIVIQKDEKLTIEQGTQIHFSRKAALIVFGTLDVKGSMDNPVVFQGDRLEWEYDDVPGQWGGIWMVYGSKNNKIDWAVIKNAEYGLIVDTLVTPGAPTLEITNTRIEHHTVVGLLGRGSTIRAYNCIFADCGFFSVSLQYGGNYEFYHCTIGNYWGLYSTRGTPALYITNYFTEEKDDGTKDYYWWTLENAYFGNCIVYGGQEYEALVDSMLVTDRFNFQFDHCLLSSDPKKNPLNDDSKYKNCIINPPQFRFKNVDFKSMIYDYELDTLSVAKDAGSLDIVNKHFDKLGFDLKNASRTLDQKPDLGAFERIESE